MFEQYGLRKTTVDELARGARISKGAFYLFYGSKEELYFDILELVEKEFREKLFVGVFMSGETRMRSFKNFLRRFFDLMTTEPLYMRLTPADYDFLLRKLPRDILEAHINRDRDSAARYFGDWMEKGFIRQIDMGTLNGLLVSLVHVIMHREDFGGNNFDAVKEMWVDMISLYLVREE